MADFAETPPSAAMDLSTRQVRETALYVGLGQVVAKVLTFLTGVLVVRALKDRPGEFGLYRLLLGTLVYLSFATNLGILGSLQRFVPEFFVRRQHGNIRKLARFSLLFNLAAALVVCGALAATFGVWSDAFKLRAHRDAVLVFLIFAIVMLQSNTLMVLLNNVFLNKERMVAFAGYSALKIGLIFAFRRELSLTRLVLIELASAVPLLLSYHFFFWRRFGVRASATGEGKIDRRRFLRFSLYNAGIAPGGLVNDYASGNFLVGYFRPGAELGMFSFAAQTRATLLQLLPQNILQTVIRPVFYAKYSTGDSRRRLNDMFNLICKTNLLILLPVFLFLAVQGKPFIRYVYAPEFLPAYPVVLMAFGFATLTFFELGADLTIQAVERIEFYFMAQIFALYNLAAAVFFLRAGYAVEWVAFANGSAVLLRNLFVYFFARRYGGLRFHWPSYAKIALNSALACLAMWGVARLTHGLTGFALASGAGALAYLAATLAFLPFTRKEAEYLSQVSGGSPAARLIRSRLAGIVFR